MKRINKLYQLRIHLSYNQSLMKMFGRPLDDPDSWKPQSCLCELISYSRRLRQLIAETTSLWRLSEINEKRELFFRQKYVRDNYKAHMTDIDVTYSRSAQKYIARDRYIFSDSLSGRELARGELYSSCCVDTNSV